MAWGQAADKPLSEPMMTYFTDTYVSLDLNLLSKADVFILHERVDRHDSRFDVFSWDLVQDDFTNILQVTVAPVSAKQPRASFH